MREMTALSRRQFTMLHHTKRVLHLHIRQDLLAVNGTEAERGQRLISCGLDRAVHVWDIQKGTYVQVGHVFLDVAQCRTQQVFSFTAEARVDNSQRYAILENISSRTKWWHKLLWLRSTVRI